MPSIPINSTFGYLGIFFLLAGAFLIVAGIGILKVDNVSVRPGRRTWGLGALAVALGILLLAADFAQANSPTLAPSTPSVATPAFNPTHQAVLLYNVLSDNTPLYREPDTGSEVIDNLQQGQVVEAREERSEWLVVTYLNGTVRTTGWIQKSSVALIR